MREDGGQTGHSHEGSEGSQGGKRSKSVDWMCGGGRELIRMTHRSLGQLGGGGTGPREVGTVAEAALGKEIMSSRIQGLRNQAEKSERWKIVVRCVH